jgi:flagellar hook-basal body complex protein FliE
MEIKPMNTLPLQPLARLSSATAGESANLVKGGSGSDFTGALRKALESANRSQQQSSELQKQFQLNDPNVSLEETVIAMQKANISFQALVQVRNKFIAAYHEVMNMQV